MDHEWCFDTSNASNAIRVVLNALLLPELILVVDAYLPQCSFALQTTTLPPSDLVHEDVVANQRGDVVYALRVSDSGRVLCKYELVRGRKHQYRKVATQVIRRSHVNQMFVLPNGNIGLHGQKPGNAQHDTLFWVLDGDTLCMRKSLRLGFTWNISCVSVGKDSVWWIDNTYGRGLMHSKFDRDGLPTLPFHATTLDVVDLVAALSASSLTVVRDELFLICRRYGIACREHSIVVYSTNGVFLRRFGVPIHRDDDECINNAKEASDVLLPSNLDDNVLLVSKHRRWKRHVTQETLLIHAKSGIILHRIPGLFISSVAFLPSKHLLGCNGIDLSVFS